MKSNYSKIERFFAVWLTNFPLFKKWLKLGYQKFNYFIFKKNITYQSSLTLIDFSIPGFETFAGYYDKSPINPTNDYIIYHKTNYGTFNKPNPMYPIEVVLFDWKERREVMSLKSYAYNWQQGTRCQWLDNSRFIFNDFDAKRNRYCSKIINIKHRTVEKIIDFPIYDTFNNTAFSLNFSRLAHLRPDYGYFNIRSSEPFNPRDIDDDGIYKIDLIENTSELIIPFERMLKVDFHRHFNGAIHKVNHVMINPSGDKIVFLHRYYINGRKYDRLIQSDINGDHLSILSDHDMISHYCWIENEKLIAYARRFDEGDRYYLIDTRSCSHSILGEGIIDRYGDGHPSVFGSKMIFDTYPDKSRMKGLFSFDIQNGKFVKLGSFFESFKYYGETRCDLHPSFSYDGKLCFINSVHQGDRQLFIMDLKDI